MTVSQTNRFELYTWDSGADQFLRAQMTESHINIETYAAGYLQGTRPAAALQYTGFFHWDGTDLSYCDGSDWNDIRKFGDVAPIDGTQRVGSLQSLSRSDHTHDISDSTITTAMIADLQVTTAKLNDLSVTTGKLTNSAVTNDKLFNDIDASKLTVGTIPAARIGSSAITATRLASNSVSTVKIQDAAVTTAKIEDGAVTSDKLTLTGFTSSGTIYVGPLATRITINADGSITAPTSISTSGSSTAGNWFVSTGSTGWRNSTHDGGWYMDESTTIKAYSDKDVSTAGSMIAASGFFKGETEVSYSGHTHAYLPTNGGSVNGTVTIGGTSKYLRIKDTVNNTHYVEFRTLDLNTNRTITFPNDSGTVSLDGHTHPYLSNSHDMTLTLSGDASGSAEFTNMGNATLEVTVANDSHTHDTRYYTKTQVDDNFSDTDHGHSNYVAKEGRANITKCGLDGSSYANASLVLDGRLLPNGGGAGGSSIALLHRWGGTDYAPQIRAAQNIFYFRDKNDEDNAIVHANTLNYRALDNTSSRTIKHDINYLESGYLDKVVALLPASFVYNDDESNKVRIGFIAEDVKEVLPNATSDTTGVLSVDTMAILSAAVAAIKELSDKVNALEETVAQLSK